jgi:hypothetical protein
MMMIDDNNALLFCGDRRCARSIAREIDGLTVSTSSFQRRTTSREIRSSQSSRIFSKTSQSTKTTQKGDKHFHLVIIVAVATQEKELYTL